MINPMMPIPLVVLYFVISLSTFVASSLAFVALSRTKKTPYATKRLSVELLTYDSLFLLVSCVTRLLNYNDVYLVIHITRGFQLAAQIIVCSMALERLFVLNWPYKYLEVATDKRIRVVCVGIFLFGFAQYAFVRTGVCYARNIALNCGLGMPIYFIIYTAIVPVVSFCSFFKIHKIIRRANAHGQNENKGLFHHYKGTMVSFLLINTTVSQFMWLGLSVIYFTRTARGVEEAGTIATLADWVNVINCVIDLLIYIVWFRETRMEIMKLIKRICPALKPKIEKLRIEIYQITVSQTTSQERAVIKDPL